MEADTQAHVAFFLTGRNPGGALDPVDGLGLRPALFAGYEDLTPLRYDFPLVLAAKATGPAAVESLSGLFDRALEKASQGPDGDRVRKHALKLEQEIRALLAGGAEGTLRELGGAAAERVAAQTDSSFEDSWRRLRAALVVDGEVVDCDRAMPRRLLHHVWAKAQEAKAAAFALRLQRLVLKLSAILQAEVERSRLGVAPQRLEAAVGPGFASAFDFGAMSKLLAPSQPREAMPAACKRRINGLLRVLRSQRFFAAGSASQAREKPYGFVFDSCAAALKAWRERLPRMIEVARAFAMAELEVAGDYKPERHDAVFESFGAGGLDAGVMAAFPDYLVCVDADRLDAQENTRLMEILSTGLPIKVLLQTDDLADGVADAQGAAPGMRSRQLASLAMGLNTVYVMQSTASNLFRFRERMGEGMAYRGPALFSVYSGANAKAGLPAYLMAAAAMESRAFPAFTYDPSAGANWAARFSLEANSQVDLDWPVRRFSYEDEQHQSVTQDLAFTVVDFLAADARLAAHLARVPRAKWNGSMVPVDESLARQSKGAPDKVPSVLMVDSDNRLQKIVVDQSLLRQAARCREMWHSLQELGGIHNSHAEQLLAREQQAWQERAQQQGASVAPAAQKAASAAPAVVALESPPVADAVEEPQRDPDEAFIETARCSTCNECTQINNKMFAYNSNQQAYIADINAGTYAQLVEAAESCQVAVIHPGKPRNPAEPGLTELLKRSEAFA